MEKSKFKKSEFYFVVVLAIIHIVFFIYAMNWGNIYVGDFKEYLQQAVNIKEHLNWYSEVYKEPFQPDFYSRRPPAYAFFIFLIKSIYNSDYAVLFVQAVLSCLNFFGLIKLLGKYNFRFDFTNLLLVFIIFYPSQFIYTNIIMSEILFQTFLFWSFYNFIQFIKSGENKYIFYYNLFIAFAILTKPVLYFFGIMNLLFMIYFFIKNKRDYSSPIAGLIPLVTILMVSFYNYKVTGYFHYSSLKYTTLLEYNTNYIIIKKEGFEKSISKYETDKLRLDSITDYAEKSKEKERIAYQYIKENFGEYLKLHLKGMTIFFLDPGRFDFAEFFGIKNTEGSGIYYVYLTEGYPGVINYIIKLPLIFILYLVCVFIINIIMIISIINFIFEKRVRSEIKIYFITIIAYLGLLSGIVGALRYKLPLLPIIFFSIPFLFDRVKSYLLKRKSLKESTKIN